MKRKQTKKKVSEKKIFGCNKKARRFFAVVVYDPKLFRQFAYPGNWRKKTMKKEDESSEKKIQFMMEVS